MTGFNAYNRFLKPQKGMLGTYSTNTGMLSNTAGYVLLKTHYS